jgi:hypothetical protein
LQKASNQLPRKQASPINSPAKNQLLKQESSPRKKKKKKKFNVQYTIQANHDVKTMMQTQ